MADYTINKTGAQIDAALNQVAINATDIATLNTAIVSKADIAYKWTGSVENSIDTTTITGFPTTGVLVTIEGRIKYCDASDNKLTFTASYDDLAAHGNGIWYTFKVKQNTEWKSGNAHMYWNSSNLLGISAAMDGWQDTTFIIEQIIVTK